MYDYDFTNQKLMLEAALSLLEDKGLLEKTAFGGGTALSAVYWQHRDSTDIDMFIYGSKNENALQKIRPGQWSESFKSMLHNMGDINIKNPSHYLEISLGEDKKIQFFDVLPKTGTPFTKTNIWGRDINVESVEEIIAKKIYYRAEKGNSRDIFDIAVALYHDPEIFVKLNNIGNDRIEALLQTCRHINIDVYREEIEIMQPREEYSELAMSSVEFVSQFAELHLNAYKDNIILSAQDIQDVRSVILTGLNIEPIHLATNEEPIPVSYNDAQKIIDDMAAETPNNEKVVLKEKHMEQEEKKDIENPI